MSEQPMECPKCGRQGLVRCEHGADDLFQCVYCDYRHDLTTASHTPKLDWMNIILALIGTGILLMALFPL